MEKKDALKLRLVAMDTENDVDGKLGQWSVATRDNDGQLIVFSTNGCSKKKELTKLFKDSIVAFHNYKWEQLGNKQPCVKSR